MQDIDSWGVCEFVGMEVNGNSVLFTQFCFEPKTTQKFY